MQKLLVRLLFVVAFVAVLVIFIAFARGYRFNPQNGAVTSTGILSINSSPKPAQVYVNGKAEGVTDINLTLPNGKYTVEIKKDGYSELKKTILLKGEIVTSINALLFPKNPSLSPLTNLGILKAIPVDGTDKILLFVDNGDVEKDGIYLFESTKKTISIFPPLTLLLLKKDLPVGIDLKNTDVYFSSDNQEAIFTYTIDDVESSYILSLQEENTDLFDMTSSKATVINAWQQEKVDDLAKILETYPKPFRAVASDSFRIISYSANETKILYQAKKDLTLPMIIKPPLIGANQTPEVRELKKDSLYVYDKKEDKNFVISLPIIESTEVLPELDASLGTSAAQLLEDDTKRADLQSYISWYPDSQHLVVKGKSEIDILDYDGTNRITVYSGPFAPEFFAISPDWNIVILANLNPQNNKYGDLYSIGIR